MAKVPLSRAAISGVVVLFGATGDLAKRKLLPGCTTSVRRVSCPSTGSSACRWTTSTPPHSAPGHAKPGAALQPAHCRRGLGRVRRALGPMLHYLSVPPQRGAPR